jgi:hypothetical protein
VRPPQKVVFPRAQFVRDGIRWGVAYDSASCGTGQWAVGWGSECTAVCSAVVLSGELSVNLTKVFSLGSRSTAP